MGVTAVFAVLILSAGALYQFAESRRTARVCPPPGEMIDIGGQRLHVVCSGDGTPPVIFESGIAASSLSWTRVLPRVASFTRACAYDRAGLGWSGPRRGARTVTRMLGELQGVLATAAPAGPYILVGHSFGAFLVCAYASRHPAEIAGLVLLDPPSEWHDMTPERARLLRGGIHLSRIGGVLARFGIVRACLALLTGGAPGVSRSFARIFGPTAARTLERLVGEVRKLPPEVHPTVQALWSEPKCFYGMANHLAALQEGAAMVARITSLPDIPLIVISASDHSPDTIARHRALARLSSQGRHLIAGIGHWVQFDDPELVVTAIRDVAGPRVVDSLRAAEA
jgi:pimeloyl-ACP methyl ester carboxylesterase